MTHPSLPEALQGHAERQPHKAAYIFVHADGREDSITFRDLYDSSRRWAGKLHLHHDRDSALLLCLPPGLAFLKAFFACLYAAIPVVPLYPPAGSRLRERTTHVLRNSRARSIITTSTESLLWLRNAGNASIQHLTLDMLDSGDEAYSLASLPTADGIAFLQYTSGSTSHPKGVVVTHRMLTSNERHIAAAFGHSPDTCAVGWLPLYHDMGLVGNALQGPYVGFTSILMSPGTFLRDPFQWLKQVSDRRATTSGGPNFAYDLCCRRIGDIQLELLDLTSWEVAFNGSEPVRTATMEAFAGKFSRCGFRRSAFFPCYGLAEATLFVSGGHWLESGGDVNNQTASPGSLVSCGCPGEGIEVRVATEQADPVSDGVVGEILLCGPSIATRYWADDSTCSWVSVADGHAAPRKWLRTGDLGALVGGNLYVAGRAKELIIVRGRNVHPADLEEAVSSAGLERDMIDAVVAFGCNTGATEGIGLALELTRKGVSHLRKHKSAEQGSSAADLLARTVRLCISTLIQLVDVAPTHIAFVNPGGIPRTTSGKVQRHRFATAMQQGWPDAVHVWPAAAASADDAVPDVIPAPTQEGQDVRARVRRVVTGWLSINMMQLKHSTIADDQSLSAMGVDSMGVAALIVALENEFHVHMDDNLVYEFTTIEQLAQCIATRVDAGLARPGKHAVPPSSH